MRSYYAGGRFKYFVQFLWLTCSRRTLVAISFPAVPLIRLRIQTTSVALIGSIPRTIPEPDVNRSACTSINTQRDKCVSPPIRIVS